MAIERISYVPESPQAPNKPALPPIDITDTASLKSLAMTALVEIVQGAPRNVSLVSAIRELIDRIEGKAPQSIAMTVEDKGIAKLSDERLLRLERELARMTGQDAIVIAPLPSKLTDT